MKRTQIYITEEQDRRLTDRAHDAGVPKAEIIRRILDSSLNLGDDLEARVRALEETAGIMADAPSWRVWLADVRSGRDAENRIQQLES